MTTKREVLEAVPAVSCRKVDNNTYEWTDNAGDKHIRLHHTDIITHRYDGDVVLDTGGWKTPTTKDRINKFAPVSVYQQDGEWFVTQGNVTVMFYDGMVLTSGCLRSEDHAPDPNSVTRIQFANLLKTFTRRFDITTHADYDDCAKCLTLMEYTTPELRAIPPGDPIWQHVINHVCDGYVSTSTVLLSLKWAGYNTDTVHIHGMFFPESILKRTFRRFAKYCAGIV